MAGGYLLATNCLRTNNPDGGTGRTAYVSPFWPTSTDLKSFFLEYYVKLIADGWPTTAYFLSSGFGGAHAILAGVQLTGGIFKPTGNVRRFDGVSTYNSIDFLTDAGFGISYGEWAHVAYGFDSATCTLYTWVNGICTGITSFGTPGTHVRQIQPSDIGTDIYVAGGSNHSMLSAYFAQMRLFDGAAGQGNAYTPSTPEAPMLMDRVLGPLAGSFTLGAPADMLFDFTVGSGVLVPDLSRDGRQGDHVRRAATLTNTLAQGFGGCPQWDYDAAMPCRLDDVIPALGDRVRTPTAPPVGAIVYDSFERANDTNMQGRDSRNVQLGDVEVGVAGSKTWAYANFPGFTNANPKYFGILCGYAVPLFNSRAAIAYVETGIANHQAQADAYGLGTRKRCGVVARVVDGSNFVYAFQTTDGATSVYFGKVVAGVDTPYNGGAAIACNPAGSWATLRINANGSSLTLQTDSNSIFTTTDQTAPSGSKAGILFYNASAPTASSTARAKNFLVKAAF